MRVCRGVRLAVATYMPLAMLMVSMRCYAQSQPPTAPDRSIEALSDEANDPTASLTQVQIRDSFTPATFGSNAQPNTVLLRPILAVMPHGPMDLRQIVRPTFSLVTIPQGKGAATRTEFGDIQLLDLMIMPWPDVNTTEFRWGVGPYFVFPAATSHSAGQSAWQAGPAFAFKYRPFVRLQISALFQQATSFSYTSGNASPITVIMFQPMLSYRLGHGWYLRSSDATWRVNLRHGTSTRIPVSGGIGKVWKFARGAAINASISGEWMAYRQYSPQAHQFTVKLQATLLLPEVHL